MILLERFLLLIVDYLIPLLLLWGFWRYFRKVFLLEDRKENIKEAKILKEFVNETKPEEINKKTIENNNKINQFIKKGKDLK